MSPPVKHPGMKIGLSSTSYEISFDAAPTAEEEDYRDDLVDDDDFLADGMQRIQAVGKDDV